MMLPDNCVGIIEYCFMKYDKTIKLDPGDYIVLIRYKYDHEEHYHYETNILSTFDNHFSLFDDDGFLLNDTYEGQQYFEIYAYCPLDIDPNYMKEIFKEVEKNGS